MTHNVTELHQPVKVFLPGESLFAIPLRYANFGMTLHAKIDNHPVSPLHDFKYGDEAEFKLDRYNSWELVVDEQS